MEGNRFVTLHALEFRAAVGGSHMGSSRKKVSLARFCCECTLRLRAQCSGERQFSKIGSPFRVLFRRVPYYIGDLNKKPNLENYPFIHGLGSHVAE